MAYKPLPGRLSIDDMAAHEGINPRTIAREARDGARPYEWRGMRSGDCPEAVYRQWLAGGKCTVDPYFFLGRDRQLEMAKATQTPEFAN